MNLQRPAIAAGFLVCLVAIAVMGLMAPGEVDAAAPYRSAESCGLPPSDPKLRANQVPGFARIPGFEIVSLETKGENVFGSVNVPLDVAALRDAVRARITSVGYPILYEDFEGFEAEIFIEVRDHTGIVRMARSRCDGFSSLSFQLAEE